MRLLLSVTLGLACLPTLSQAQMVGGMITSVQVGEGSSIKGLPFSADVVEETDQVLADGNRIHHEMHGKTFRDSQGRTRNENEIAPLGAQRSDRWVMIVIIDPVEHLYIRIDPRTKTAMVHHMGAFQLAETIKARIPVSSQSGPQNRAARSSHTGTKMSTEDLGTTDIEGLPAKGSRLTTTVPAGAAGNERPLVTVSEMWISTELNVPVLTVGDSPQSGKTTRKLVNIQRGEPDPARFQPPADYTLKDNTAQN